MTMPREYEEYLRTNLSFLARLGDVFTGLDTRQNYTNLLLTKILTALGGGAATPPGEDEDGRPPPTPGLGYPKNKSSFITGQLTLAAASTAQQLVEYSAPIEDGYQLTIVAWPTNTGYIYIGKEKGSAEGASSFNGLAAGLAISLRVTNVNLVWVSATVAGEGVSFIVEHD